MTIILSFSLGNFIVMWGVEMIASSSLNKGRPVSALYDVHGLTKRYLIMIDFDPFLSLKLVSRWAYPIVLVVSPTKPIIYSGNGSIWLSCMPNCWNTDQ